MEQLSKVPRLPHNRISHITETLTKIDKIIRILYPIINRRNEISTNVKLNIFKTYIRPALLYAAPVISLASSAQIKRLQTKQNKILRVLLNKEYRYNTKLLHKESAIVPIIEFIQTTSERFRERCLQSEYDLIRNLY